MFKGTTALCKPCRPAAKAGTWYEDNQDILNGQLGQWLSEASESSDEIEHSNIRGLIVPHAGYSYSGSTAAFSYKYINAEKIR